MYQYLYTKLLILIASTHDTKTVLYIIATPWFHLWWPGQPNSNSNSSCTKLQAPLAPARKSQKTPACFREVANPKQLQSVSMGQQWSTTSSPSVFCDARGVSSVRRFCCTTCGRIPALRQETWAMGMGMGYSLPSLPYLGLGDLGIPGSVWNLAIAPNYNYADIVVFFERGKLWSIPVENKKYLLLCSSTEPSVYGKNNIPASDWVKSRGYIWVVLFCFETEPFVYFKPWNPVMAQKWLHMRAFYAKRFPYQTKEMGRKWGINRPQMGSPSVFGHWDLHRLVK